VSAKGLEQLFAQIEVLEEGAEGSREVTAVDGLKVATKAFVPIYNMLDADVSIEGVQYAEGKAAVTVRADGKLELAMPERIAHINMNNIRVAGTTTGSFGDISLRDIQFHPDSRMVIYGR
ncbi:MAG: pilus assembly protein PilB, partial [Gammaproteobacteria bacterium]|nr:pilus assembly protein PilB [Gammaproteobacteria bacterium]